MVDRPRFSVTRPRYLGFLDFLVHVSPNAAHQRGSSAAPAARRVLLLRTATAAAALPSSAPSSGPATRRASPARRRRRSVLLFVEAHVALARRTGRPIPSVRRPPSQRALLERLLLLQHRHLLRQLLQQVGLALAVDGGDAVQHPRAEVEAVLAERDRGRRNDGVLHRVEERHVPHAADRSSDPDDPGGRRRPPVEQGDPSWHAR